MTPDPGANWREILKRIAWYLWIGLAPLVKAWILTLDSTAIAAADRDPTNDLHKTP